MKKFTHNQSCLGIHSNDFRIGTRNADGEILPALEAEFSEGIFESEEILDIETPGVRIITEKTIKMQHERATAASFIPVKEVTIFTATAKTGQNCQNGDIDNCQNYSWCAKCIDKSRIETSVDAVLVPSGHKEILDEEAYRTHIH